MVVQSTELLLLQFSLFYFFDTVLSVLNLRCRGGLFSGSGF